MNKILEILYRHQDNEYGDFIAKLVPTLPRNKFIGIRSPEYKKIIKESYQYLKYGGYLCLEIGFDQKIDVIELIENEEKFENTYSKKDLYDNDRVIVTRIK